MKLFFVIGTRPNIIKLCPVLKKALQYPNFNFKVVHTGQHFDYEMSSLFFDELGLPTPDFFLEADNTTQARQTASIMVAFEDLCKEEQPDAVVVFGDVNSTLASALVAAKLRIPSFHIEAGLRSFNKNMPEEINRLVADQVCDYLFAPSENAMINLNIENLASKSCLTGDLMFDAVLQHIKQAQTKSNILNTLGIKSGAFYLATLHRPYNVDDKYILKEIMEAFSEIDEKIVFSVHPRTFKNLNAYKISIPENIISTKPLGYFDFLMLQQNSKKIITDSGGIQKEAFFLKKPCVTLRPETEWVETVSAGANVLVKSRKKDAILEAIKSQSNADFSKNIYGTGNAAELILDNIKKFLSKTS